MGHRGAGFDNIQRLLVEEFGGVVVKDISELLNIELNLTAANGSEIPYIGWVALNFRLPGSIGSLIKSHESEALRNVLGMSRKKVTHEEKNVLCANGSLFRRELTKSHESEAVRYFLGMSRK